MKIKVNKKDVKNAYNNIITIGYCNGWYLLSANEPDFYTCGVYGWNEDIYKIDYNTIITTGYRPINNGLYNYEITTLYNEKARLIYNNSALSWEQKQNKINKLLEKYVKTMLSGAKNEK